MKEKMMKANIIIIITIVLMFLCSIQTAYAENVPDSIKSQLVIGEDGRIWSSAYNMWITQDDFMVMTRTTFAETMNGDAEGQAAVAKVIMNRAYYGSNDIQAKGYGKWPSTPARVCSASGQFDAYNKGMSYGSSFINSEAGQTCAEAVAEVLNNPNPYGIDMPLYVHFYQTKKYHYSDGKAGTYGIGVSGNSGESSDAHHFSYRQEDKDALINPPVLTTPESLPAGLPADSIIKDSNGNTMGYVALEIDSLGNVVQTPHLFDSSSIPSNITPEYIRQNGYYHCTNGTDYYAYTLADGRVVKVKEDDSTIIIGDVSSCAKHGTDGMCSHVVGNKVAYYCKFCSSAAENKPGAQKLEQNWDTIAQKMGIGGMSYSDAQKYSPQTIADMQKVMSNTSLVNGHSHDLTNSYIKWTYKNANGCTARTVTVTCTKCNNNVLFEGSAPANHVWRNKSTSRSCSEKWGLYRQCAVCGTRDDSLMKNPEHVFPPVSLTGNCTTLKCAYCNTYMSHNFTGVQCQRTCSQCGIKSGTYGIHNMPAGASKCKPNTALCTYGCGNVVAAAPEHNMKYTYSGPDCKPRSYTAICQNCWKNSKSGKEVVAISTHTWKTTSVKSEATCAAEGVYTRQCQKCWTREDVTTPKLPHDYSKPIYKHESLVSCTRDGVSYATCTCYNCGNTSTEKIVKPATGHNKKYEIVTQPTCSQTGEGRTVCLNWGCSYSVSSPIAKTRHAIVPASCTEPTHCNACSYTVGEALGHSWTGVIKKTCSRCGATKWF